MKTPDPIIEENLKNLLQTQRFHQKQPSDKQTDTLLKKIMIEVKPKYFNAPKFPNFALGMLTLLVFFGLGLGLTQYGTQVVDCSKPLFLLLTTTSLINWVLTPLFTIYIIQNRRKKQHETLD